MFFILHLLMAAGVELHLQKTAEAAAQKELEEKARKLAEPEESPHEEEHRASFGFVEPVESMTAISTNELLDSLKVKIETLPTEAGDGDINLIEKAEEVPEQQQRPGLPVTRLAPDHNYLAVENKTDFKFIMAPNSRAEFFGVEPLPYEEKKSIDQGSMRNYANEDYGEGYEADISGNNTRYNTAVSDMVS